MKPMSPGSWLDCEWFGYEDPHAQKPSARARGCQNCAPLRCKDVKEIVYRVRLFIVERRVEIRYDNRTGRAWATTDGATYIKCRWDLCPWDELTSLLHELVHVWRGDIVGRYGPERYARNEIFTGVTMFLLMSKLGWNYAPSLIDSHAQAIPEVASVVRSLGRKLKPLFRV